MPYYWFSTYTGKRWTPDKGYNGTFRDQVVLIRNWFHLNKVKAGRDRSSGYWREYTLQGETVYITVDKFSWDGYSNNFYDLDYDGDRRTPVFSLDIRISEKPAGKKVILTDTLTIMFPRRYPSSPPAFYTKRHGEGTHIYSHGWMCILGHGDDWNPNKDTIISGLNAAFDLLVYNWKYC